MLLLLSFSFSAFSSEFTHIKLNPEVEEYLTKSGKKSKLAQTLLQNSLSAVSSKEQAAQMNLQSQLMNVLLGSTGYFPADGEESPLFEEIRRQLEGAHNQIGLSQVQTINTLNQQFNLGTSNFSGFSWQKPFGVVQVYADRQVTPNIFAQNWLVMDTFTFEIEATTFLERLAEAGMSGMSATEIGAFAGITFKRVYTYWHYAESYQRGLGADFSKLFLLFVKFNQSGMERMGNEEIMKREDLWSASAGGLISTPPLYNLSFSAGALAQHDYQNTSTIQSQFQGDHRFKVGISSKKTTTAGVSLELQLDFFKLIKLSLLRYDLEYEYASGKEITLGLNQDDWRFIKTQREESREFKSLLRGIGTVKKLEPFVVRLDESSSSAASKRGSILLWGKVQKQKTEQIRVIKDNKVRVFFKNYAQNVKVVQNFFSRIFSALFYKIFKLPIGVNNAAIFSQQLQMEYEATHPQSANPKITRLDSTEQFSFALIQYYNAARTDRWVDRRFKKDLIWFVDNFTTLPKSYKSDIRNEILKGPMIIESTLRVEKAGMHYLLNSSEDSVFSKIARICRSKKVQLWSQSSSRKELLESRQQGAEACVKKTGLKYLGFKYDFIAHHFKPSIARFKEFVTRYYKKSQNLQDLQDLFGEENTFINGRLQAQTGLGFPFNTTFSSGQFRGLGVIDNFKRAEGSRVPASIISE